MGYRNTLFPTSISHGSTFGPSFKTLLTEVEGGAAEAVSLYPTPRYRFDVSTGIKTKDAIQQFLEFYLVQKAAAHTFPFEDPLDHSTAASWSEGTPANTDQVLGAGDGSTTEFQLKKVYELDGFTTSRPITKPKAGTVLVAIDGAAQSEGVDFTVDELTGIVTFDSAPSPGAVLTWGGNFYVPVRFSQAIDVEGMRGLLEGPDVVTIPGGIPLEEDVTAVVVEDELFMGNGSEQVSWSGTKMLTPAMGRMVRLAPTADSTLLLQSPSLYPSGGIHYQLQNDSAFDIDLKIGATTVGTIAAGETGLLFIPLVSGVKTWKVAVAA